MMTIAGWRCCDAGYTNRVYRNGEHKYSAAKEDGDSSQTVRDQESGRCQDTPERGYPVAKMAFRTRKQRVNR